MIEKIYKRLALLTQGLNKQQKLKFIKTLGYNSVADLEKLTDDEKEDLYNTLLAKDVTKYEIYETSTHIITRPKKPKNVKDISFKIKGFTP